MFEKSFPCPAKDFFVCAERKKPKNVVVNEYYILDYIKQMHAKKGGTVCVCVGGLSNTTQ